MYGGAGMMGFNPMMNPMMMGMNPMMTGGWGFPGMMPGFANPQQFMAAQQAAQQAYQQAMYAFSTVGSQIGGGDGQSPGQMPMNPMMTGQSMGMGGFDPRMSMMGMPMMSPSMGMNPAMGMGMGSGSEHACKISMMWNWCVVSSCGCGGWGKLTESRNTIDACFISEQWHIRSKGAWTWASMNVDVGPYECGRVPLRMWTCASTNVVVPRPLHLPQKHVC